MSMRRVLSGVCVVVAALGAARSARAQAADNPPAATPAPAAAEAPAPAPVHRVGIRAFGGLEYQFLLANVAYQDELGASKFATLAAGVDVTNIWHRVFVRFDVSHLSKDGSRGFIDSSNQFVSLNDAMTVSMTPVDIGAGWRLEPPDKGTGRAPRLTPYVGAGLTILKYGETSAHSIPGEDVAATYKGAFFLLGADIAVQKYVIVAVEGVFRSVPVTPSSTGILSVLNENNLGSGGVRVMIAVKY
jgi:hypothetical protein